MLVAMHTRTFLPSFDFAAASQFLKKNVFWFGERAWLL
jgi:hypothetical protein